MNDRESLELAQVPIASGPAAATVSASLHLTIVVTASLPSRGITLKPSRMFAYCLRIAIRGECKEVHVGRASRVRF